MLIINTSYGYDKLSLKIGINGIIVCMCPLSYSKKKFHFEYEDCMTGKIRGISLPLETGLNIPYLFKGDGSYYLNIYVQSETDYSCYVSYIQPKSIKIQCLSHTIRFANSPILIKNSSIINGLSHDQTALNYYTESNKYFDYSSLNMVMLAKSITKNCITARQKALAIHDWIAKHIYYDYDALNNGTYAYRNNTAVAILRDKRCVCVGFSYLMVTLLRAVGVPAMGQHCFALNISNDGGWNYGDNLTSPANHMLTLAYFENKWRIIDVTWDTFNRFQGNQFIQNVDKTLSRIYFDSTIEFISNTHRFIK